MIRAIYEAVEQMGFHSGNILEPSCGVGNFFGMLPESMGESKLYGVELDSITGASPASSIPMPASRSTALRKRSTRMASLTLPSEMYRLATTG